MVSSLGVRISSGLPLLHINLPDVLILIKVWFVIQRKENGLIYSNAESFAKHARHYKFFFQTFKICAPDITYNLNLRYRYR